ncbi:Myosin-J heavy chain, partial [Smittium culicis]
INSRNSSVILFSKIDTISKERLSTISDSFNKSTSDLSKVEDGDRDLSKLILQSCIEDRTQYQVGLTKVFFRAGQWANLENMRAKLFNDSAEVIQKNYKKYLYRKKYIQTKDSALIIQKWWKQKSFELKVRRFKQKCASVKIFNFWKVQKEKQAERMRIIEENAKKLAESNANNNFPTNIPYRTSSLSAGVCLPYSSMMIPRSSSGLNIPGDNSRLSLIFRDRSIVSSEAKYSMISEINNSVISNQNNAPWEQVKTFCLENRNYRNRLESDQTDTETLVFPIINRKSCPDVSELTQTNNSDVNVFKRDAKNTRPRIYTLPLDSERLYSIIAYGDKMEAFRRGYSVSSESSLVQDRQIFDKLGYKSSQIGLNIEGQIGASNIQSRNVLLKNYTFGDFSTSENLNELGKINKVEKYGKPTNFHNINIANSNQKISNISNNISIVFENNNGMTRIPLTKNRVTNGYTHVGNNDKKYSGRNSFSSESLRKSFGTVDYQNMPSYKRSFDKSYESFFGPGEFNKQKSSSTIDHRIDTLISPKSIESFNAKVLKRIRERGLSKINPVLIQAKSPTPGETNKFVRPEKVKEIELKARKQSLGNFTPIQKTSDRRYVKNAYKYNPQNSKNEPVKRFNNHITTPTQISFGRHTRARAQYHSRKVSSSSDKSKNVNRKNVNSKGKKYSSNSSKRSPNEKANDEISLIFEKNGEDNILIPVESYDIYNSFYLSKDNLANHSSKSVHSFEINKDLDLNLNSYYPDENKGTGDNLSQTKNNLYDSNPDFVIVPKHTNGDHGIVSTRSKYRETNSPNQQLLSSSNHSHQPQKSKKSTDTNTSAFIKSKKSFLNIKSKLPFVSRIKASNINKNTI